MTKISKPTGSPPADVFDATEALRNGQTGPIGWYLEDAAEILSRISDCLDPRNANQADRRLEFGAEPMERPANHAKIGVPDDSFYEWVGSLPQVEAAIEKRAPKPLGWYLRELGGFLGHLAPAFNPPNHWRDWQLQFIRKGRGRRYDPMKQMLHDSDTAMMLRLKTRRAGKQEAAIEDLKGRPGASRANLFKRKRRAQRRGHESR